MSTFIEVQRLVLLNKPKTVLDVGIGMGMNGAGVRDWLDMGYVKNFNTEIIGIEVFEKYKNPCWGLYNEVIISTVEEFLKVNRRTFDMVIMTDVIEHFEMRKGVEVLEGLKRVIRSKGVLLVSTPGVWFEQGPAHGNEHERHRSSWTEADFRSLGFGIVPNVNSLNKDYGHQMILAEFIKN